jgi:hypothetical protein
MLISLGRECMTNCPSTEVVLVLRFSLFFVHRCRRRRLQCSLSSSQSPPVSSRSPLSLLTYTAFNRSSPSVFDELEPLLERCKFLNSSAFVANDLNIRHDTADDHFSVYLRSKFDITGAYVSTSGPTYRSNGMRDIVAAYFLALLSVVEADH